MAMAIGIVIGAVIIISIPIIIIVGIMDGGELADDDEAVGAVDIGVSFVLEGLLLLAAALFTVRKYKLSWATLGLRPPTRGGFWFPLPVFFAASCSAGCEVVGVCWGRPSDRDSSLRCPISRACLAFPCSRSSGS